MTLEWVWGLSIIVLVPAVYLLVMRLLHPKLRILHAEPLCAGKPRRLPQVLRLLAYAAIAIAFVALAIAGTHPYGGKTRQEAYTEAHTGCLVLDISGSMYTKDKSDELKIKVAADALISFMEGRPGDYFCLIYFAATESYPVIRRFSNDVNAMIQALELAPTQEEGTSTAMGDGLFAALLLFVSDALGGDQHLTEERIAGLLRMAEASKLADFDELKNMSGASLYGAEGCAVGGDGRRSNGYVVVTSDADSNEGLEPKEILPIFARCNIRVYLIGVGFNPANHADLERHITATGGKIFFAETANALPNLYAEIDTLQKRKVATSPVFTPEDYTPRFALLALLFLVPGLFIWGMLRNPLVWWAIHRLQHRTSKERR